MREEIDADAVRRVLAGDRSAFAELYDRYARLVRSICFEVTRNIDDANDICQEVFMAAYRDVGGLREPGRFAFWLTGMTRRKVADWQRRKYRDRRSFVESVPEPSQRNHDKPDQNGSEGTDLLALIQELPETERMALHLFYLDEQPAEAARVVLNLSQSGFYKTLARARDLLANKMKTVESRGDE